MFLGDCSKYKVFSERDKQLGTFILIFKRVIKFIIIALIRRLMHNVRR